MKLNLLAARILCALITAFTSLSASAYDTYEINGITYAIDDNSDETFVTSNTNYSGNINVPEFINFNNKIYSVTGIGASAFSNCENLTAVKLPKTIKSIGVYAFKGCSKLAEISIPEGVTILNSATFEECTSLTSVTLPNSLTTIGRFVFNKCI